MIDRLPPKSLDLTCYAQADADPMSAPPPSFSSFPPTFNSFPDVEAGPSKPKQELSATRRDEHHRANKSRDEDKATREKRKRDMSANDKDKGKKKSRRDRDTAREHAGDDRLSTSKESGLYSTATNSTFRLYYSDRKGDALNAKYGGPHKGDIPKHYLLASEHSH
jgi:hypothetical protein